jgi:hypothetical protein
MADDETEDIGVEQEGAPAGAEFVPEASHKPKSDVYSLVLILTFVAFLAGSIVAGREAWEHYDVQFWVFNKDGKRQEAPPAPAAEPAAPAAAPAPAPAPAAPEAPKNP